MAGDWPISVQALQDLADSYIERIPTKGPAYEHMYKSWCGRERDVLSPSDMAVYDNNMWPTRYECGSG